jgi:hypothetical protein
LLALVQLDVGTQVVAVHRLSPLPEAIDIQDTDTNEEIRQKVTQFLKVLQIDEATHMPYLLELLAVKDSGINKIPMSPEEGKTEPWRRSNR